MVERINSCTGAVVEVVAEVVAAFPVGACTQPANSDIIIENRIIFINIVFMASLYVYPNITYANKSFEKEKAG